MRRLIVITVIFCALLILFLNDARQRPAGPAYSYARRGFEQMTQAVGNEKMIENAMESLYEALRMDPKDPLALFGMGWALQSKGWGQQAEEYYAKALVESDGIKKFSHLNLSLILQSKEDFRGAIDQLDRALTIEPLSPLAWARKAKLLIAAGQEEEIVEAYQSAIRLDIGNGFVFLDLGSALQRCGQEQLAQEAWLKALKIDPGLAEEVEERKK